MQPEMVWDTPHAAAQLSRSERRRIDRVARKHAQRAAKVVAEVVDLKKPERARVEDEITAEIAAGLASPGVV